MSDPDAQRWYIVETKDGLTVVPMPVEEARHERALVLSYGYPTHGEAQTARAQLESFVGRILIVLTQRGRA